MRLICPNCDAQYEVPDEVIPKAGRDVQCSNCGQTWFQHHADFVPEETQPEEPHPSPDEEVAPAPPPPPPAAERDEPAPRPPRRELDPAVAEVLREEAEREQRRRAQESDALESQPDLGLEQHGEDEAERRARQARERMARMRGEKEREGKVSEAAATAAAVGSRRDLLPDIEEINSTLRSTSDRVATSPDEGTVEPVRRQRRGFRTGFLIILLIAVLAILLYIFAPKIAEMMPALEPTLTSYIASVDALRLWLDGQLQSALQWLDRMASQSSGTPSE